MKKKRFILWLVLLFFTKALFAGERVVDNAGLLNNAQAENLKTLLDSIAASYNFDLVIVTEEDIGNTESMEYADDFFDYNGYGLGEDRDGCLFLVVTGSRDYWFSTSGRGIKILNSSAFNKLENDVLKSLKNNDYYSAFNTFAVDWEQFLALNAKGRNYNFFQRQNLVLTGIGWLVALIIGFIIVQSWKSKMNTAVPDGLADVYIVPGSLVFRDKRDRFLYSTITKTKRETKSSSGGSSHTGSSGRSHGGGGGKY
ncbi:MAG: TPM domain-containing protein [Treponema sp.]|jgi:uncharacterized protein|nr:TPM domain-containing protein [Treponema sp.]